MGSGKTTVGRMLAKRLGHRFIDTDREIVRMAAQSIVSIFKKEGEAGFRKRETAAIARACKVSGAVVAVGGGAVTRRENIVAMRRTGTVVYLQAPLTVLTRRVKGGASRPLWKKARSLYSERIPFYNLSAHVRIRSGFGTPASVADRVLERI